MKNWTRADIPPRAGKLAVITGTGGLGYETALALAAAGAEVVLAGRNSTKGADALAKIRAAVLGAKVRFEELDLASLASISAFAGRMSVAGNPIDLLVNNAAVMALPTRQATADGFEMQLGTNYLGHFALTAHLLPLLRQSPQRRVVQLSSGAHHQGSIHLDDLQLEHGYTPWKAYSQSKLAMLIFALELQRRSDAAGWGLLSTAAHPGFARTDLIANGPGDKSFMAVASGFLGRFLSHSAAAGSLPTLYAATATEVQPAGYYGPQGAFEMIGPPGVAKIDKKALDLTVARRLWEASVLLTGVEWHTA
jgi:NAD(P)-dependent dehydrogenase (short-subunit alcohol dehydrogenase family)